MNLFLLFKDRFSIYDKICLSLYLYELGQVLHDFVFSANYKIIGSAISLLGVFSFIIYLVKVPKKINKSIVTCLVGIFALISFVVIFRGIFNVKEGYDKLIINKMTMMPYIMVFAFYIDVTPLFLRCILKWAFIYCISSLVFMIVYFEDLFLNITIIINTMMEWDVSIMGKITNGSQLWLPIACFLGIFPKLSKSSKLIIVVTSLLAFVAVLLGGRRSASLNMLVYMLIPFIVRFANERRSKKMKFILAFAGIIITAALFWDTNRIQDTFSERFEILSERLTRDTRSWAEEEMINDINESPLDWIWGRGMMGSFKTKNTELFNTNKREAIETGYLYMILKGGLLLLLPYIFILIISFCSGWQKSKSLFLKNCSIIVLLRFFQLYPGGHLLFTFSCFIIWIYIAICNSNYWLNKNDHEIEELLIHR